MRRREWSRCSSRRGERDRSCSPGGNPRQNLRVKCLLISFHYPPDPAIGAVRVAAIAEAMGRAGHEVKVVAAAGPASAGPAAGEVVQSPWFDVRTLRLVGPRASSGNSRRMQRSPERRQHPQPGSNGSGIADSVSNTRAMRSAFARSITPGSPLRAAIAKSRGAVLEYPDAMVGWIPGAFHKARRICGTWPCDVVVSSGPPFSAHVVAAAIAREWGIPWVADYRDLWTNGTYYDKPDWRRRLDTRLEGRLLASTAFVTTVSEPLAGDLRRDFGVKAEVALNGFDDVEVEAFGQREPLSEARLNLLFVGNNLYGGRRSPQLLFDAAAQMGLGPNDIRFHFLGTDPEFVAQTASTAGVADLVAVYPRTSQAESVAMQARADVLMLLMWNHPGEAGVYSGKIYEYIAVRRPILMVGYPHGVAADLVRSRSIGWVVSSEASAVEALGSALSAKHSSALLQDFDPSLSVGLGRAEQMTRLVALMESECAPRPT